MLGEFAVFFSVVSVGYWGKGAVTGILDNYSNYQFTWFADFDDLHQQPGPAGPNRAGQGQAGTLRRVSTPHSPPPPTSRWAPHHPRDFTPRRASMGREVVLKSPRSNPLHPYPLRCRDTDL